MSSGPTHAKINLGVIAASTTLTAFYASNTGDTASLFRVATPVLIGMVLGHWFTNDLDQSDDRHMQNYEEKRFERYFGRWAAKAHERFWHTYGLRHSHRGVSHTFVLGTASRWWYVTWRLWWLFILLYGLLPPELRPSFEAVLWVFAGNCVIDSIHTIADKLSSAHRAARKAVFRRQRRFNR